MRSMRIVRNIREKEANVRAGDDAGNVEAGSERKKQTGRKKLPEKEAFRYT